MLNEASTHVCLRRYWIKHDLGGKSKNLLYMKLMMMMTLDHDIILHNT